MENKNFEIITLMSEKEAIENRLSSLIYGAVELRETSNDKYIYLHKRVSGMSRTIYVGIFNETLYNQILQNNVESSRLKKGLKEIVKKLKALNYQDEQLSKEVMQNIDLAKRNLVDTIYKQAVLEGVAVTYLDTETIIEGGKINNVSADDVQKINNLKHAWQFILDKNIIQQKSDYNILCLINKLVEKGFYYNAGQLRTVPVSIGGTKWKPDFPIESQIKEEIINISNEQDIYTQAIDSLLFITRKQIFIDGNKRTSVIFANHILISHGAGLIVIPEDRVAEYKSLLIEYYESNDKTEIAQFLNSHCLIKI